MEEVTKIKGLEELALVCGVFIIAFGSIIMGLYVWMMFTVKEEEEEWKEPYWQDPEWREGPRGDNNENQKNEIL